MYRDGHERTYKQEYTKILKSWRAWTTVLEEICMRVYF